MSEWDKEVRALFVRRSCFLIYCSLLTSVPSYLANIFDFLSQILSHGFREATLRFVRYVLWSWPLPREYLTWKENTLLSLQLSLHWFVAFVGILRREEILFRKVPVFLFLSQDFLNKSLSNIHNYTLFLSVWCLLGGGAAFCSCHREENIFKLITK